VQCAIQYFLRLVWALLQFSVCRYLRYSFRSSSALILLACIPFSCVCYMSACIIAPGMNIIPTLRSINHDGSSGQRVVFVEEFQEPHASPISESLPKTKFLAPFVRVVKLQ